MESKRRKFSFTTTTLTVDVAVLVFILSIYTLSWLPMYSKITIGIGAMIVLLALLIASFYRVPIPREMIFYSLWMLWTLTGIFVVVNPDYYWMRMQTTAQVFFMVFSISIITYFRKSITPFYFSIVIGGIVLLYLSLNSPLLVSLFATSELDRFTGMTFNPNDFGYASLFFIMACTYFFLSQRDLFIRVIFLLLGIIGVTGVLASASRTSSFSVVAFVLIVVFIRSRRLVSERRVMMAILLFAIISAISYVGIMKALNDTLLGARYMRMLNNIDMFDPTSAESYRIAMYIEGFKYFFENPILGVGLGQIRARSYLGMYSHSDFIEVAACTGVIGIILYVAMYYILIRRLLWLTKNVRDDLTALKVDIMLATVFASMVHSLGSVQFMTKIPMVILGATIGYSLYLENTLRALDRSRVLAPRRPRPKPRANIVVTRKI